MEIKILGTGCSKCKKLEKVAREVVAEMDLNATVERVDDIQKIMEFGVMSVPGLVINNKVVVSGRAPKSKELKKILTQNM